jgi:hypothetical protein
MFTRPQCLVVGAALVLGLPLASHAAVPARIPFSGYLTTPAGVPFEGTLAKVTAALYDGQNDGANEVWRDDGLPSPSVVGGVLSIVLGREEAPLDLAKLSAAEELWLEVGVALRPEDQATPFAGRVRLLSVPYALQASSLGEHAAEEYALLDDCLPALTCGEGEVPKYTGGDWGCGPDDAGPPDVLTALEVSCSPGDGPRWDGAGWDCAPDADTLGALGPCAEGEVPKWRGGAWQCGLDNDSNLTEAEVDAYVADNGYAHASSLATIATTGQYADLEGIPAGLAALADLVCSDGQVAKRAGGTWTCAVDVATQLTEAEVDAYVSDNGYAAASSLATVATTGQYANLEGIPAGLAALATLACGEGQIPKRAGGTWTCAVDVDTQLTEAQVDAYVSDNGYAAASALATVATTGQYASLQGIPAGLAALADLACSDGQVAKRAGGTWTCAADVDTQLTEAQVDAYTSDNGYALASSLGSVDDEVRSLASRLATIEAAVWCAESCTAAPCREPATCNGATQTCTQGAALPDGAACGTGGLCRGGECRPASCEYGCNLGWFRDDATRTVSIRAANGTSLSASNPGWVTVPSRLPAKTVTLQLTADLSFVDGGPSSEADDSDLFGWTFGVTSGVSWHNSVPVFIYAVNVDDRDEHLVFGISRSPSMTLTPPVGRLGRKGAPPQPAAGTADDVRRQEAVFLITTETDLTRFAGRPASLVGATAMNKPAAADNWLIWSSDDYGFGRQALTTILAGTYRFPTGQNGAAAGRYHGDPYMAFVYSDVLYTLSADGWCDVRLMGRFLAFATNNTDTFSWHLPYRAAALAPPSEAGWLGAYNGTVGGVAEAGVLVVAEGSPASVLWRTSTRPQYRDFTQGSDSLDGHLRYKAFGPHPGQ